MSVDQTDSNAISAVMLELRQVLLDTGPHLEPEADRCAQRLTALALFDIGLVLQGAQQIQALAPTATQDGPLVELIEVADELHKREHGRYASDATALMRWVIEYLKARTNESG